MINHDENEVLFPELDADLQHFNALYPDLALSTESDYYDPSKINMLTVKNTDFTIFCHNIRSMTRHCDELHTLLSIINFKFSVISLTESWLHDDDKHLMSFEGYQACHCLRNNQRGGGIRVFVKREYSVSVIQNCSLSLEHIVTGFTS